MVRPTIRLDLDASIGQLEWTVNAYTLSLPNRRPPASSIPPRMHRHSPPTAHDRRCRTRSTSNDDESEAIVLERYRDSEALTAHMANLGELGEAMLATATVVGDLLGEPSAELAKNLAGSPVQIFAPFLSL